MFGKDGARGLPNLNCLFSVDKHAFAGTKFVNSRISCPVTEAYVILKRFFLIPRAFIFESRVEGGIPSLAAAPSGPETRPWVSANASSMVRLSSAGGILESVAA